MKETSLFESRAHNFNILIGSEESDNDNNSNNQEVVEQKQVEVEREVKIEEDNQLKGGNDEKEFETFSSGRKGKKSGMSFNSGHSNFRNGGQTGPNKSTLKELIKPSVENSIELYDFPSSLKTADIRKFLSEFEGHYRLKWKNDTSCYVVFDESSLGNNLNLFNSCFYNFFCFSS
jgi:hypothetical protein